MRKVLYILGKLSDQDTDWLIKVGQRQSIAAGQFLIQHGKPLHDLFIVLEGELRVIAPNGVQLAQVGSGDVLGEMSFVDDSPPAASVQALGAVKVLAVPSHLIRAKLASDLSFEAHFYKAVALFLADRMRSTLANLGYSAASNATATGAKEPDELDMQVLQSVHLAGARFERMLKKLMG